MHNGHQRISMIPYKVQGSSPRSMTTQKLSPPTRQQHTLRFWIIPMSSACIPQIHQSCTQNCTHFPLECWSTQRNSMRHYMRPLPRLQETPNICFSPRMALVAKQNLKSMWDPPSQGSWGSTQNPMLPYKPQGTGCAMCWHHLHQSPLTVVSQQWYTAYQRWIFSSIKATPICHFSLWYWFGLFCLMGNLVGRWGAHCCQFHVGSQV